MNSKSKTKLSIIALALLVAITITGVGCQDKAEPLLTAPAPGVLSATRVPNMELDVYVYIKQDSPTTLPANMITAPLDMDVESLAIWGVRTGDDFTFGAALTLASASQAATVHSQITPEADIWTALSGSTIYVVQGSGPAAGSLKTAITNNDFKQYDDNQALKALARLPGGGTTKLAGTAVVQPNKELVQYLARNTNPEGLGMINTMLTMARLEVVAAGLYSPRQIDVAGVAAAMKDKGGIFNLDLGMLIVAKSGLPGLLVEPAVKKFLTETEFTERSLGEFSVYQRSWDTGEGQVVPVLVRIEGNYVFAAVSGQESYAETLISGIKK